MISGHTTVGFLKCNFFVLWAPQMKCYLTPLYSIEDRHLYLKDLAYIYTENYLEG